MRIKGNSIHQLLNKEGKKTKPNGNVICLLLVEAVNIISVICKSLLGDTAFQNFINKFKVGENVRQ
jgi:hypothetical protein